MRLYGKKAIFKNEANCFGNAKVSGLGVNSEFASSVWPPRSICQSAFASFLHAYQRVLLSISHRLSLVMLFSYHPGFPSGRSNSHFGHLAYHQFKIFSRTDLIGRLFSWPLEGSRRNCLQLSLCRIKRHSDERLALIRWRKRSWQNIDISTRSNFLRNRWNYCSQLDMHNELGVLKIIVD